MPAGFGEPRNENRPAASSSLLRRNGVPARGPFLLLAASRAALEVSTSEKVPSPKCPISSVPQAEPSPLALIRSGLWHLALKRSFVGGDLDVHR